MRTRDAARLRRARSRSRNTAKIEKGSEFAPLFVLAASRASGSDTPFSRDTHRVRGVISVVRF